MRRRYVYCNTKRLNILNGLFSSTYVEEEFVLCGIFLLHFSWDDKGLAKRICVIVTSSWDSQGWDVSKKSIPQHHTHACATLDLVRSSCWCGTLQVHSFTGSHIHFWDITWWYWLTFECVHQLNSELLSALGFLQLRGSSLTKAVYFQKRTWSPFFQC